MSELNFKDRVVVVTGGAGGLGFACDLAFASSTDSAATLCCSRRAVLAS